MDFRRRLRAEEPEINFIPLIDLLLVILIFLMITTTYARFRELPLNLPGVQAEPLATRPGEIVVAVARDGRYLIDAGQPKFVSPAALADELRVVASGVQNPLVVVHADAGASHQSVMAVLEAARSAGLPRISFAARSAGP
jgi:biopolymer transport protein ExbD